MNNSFRSRIVYDIMDNRDGSPEGNDNVFKPESITILSAYGYYRFRLEALLESVKAVSPCIEIAVIDKGVWTRDAVTDEVSDRAAGWSIEYDENVEYTVDGGHMQLRGGGLVMKTI